MKSSIRLSWPALVAGLAAPLYMLLYNEGIRPTGFAEFLNTLFYPGLVAACLIASFRLSRNLTGWMRVAYLVTMGAIVIGVCVFFAARRVLWLQYGVVPGFA